MRLAASMIEQVESAAPAVLAAFECIIDVRSPAEFDDDHLPRAVNLPVLSNEERARIGTIFVQESRLLARRLGAVLVARNIAAHLEGPLADMPVDFAPLIYCWRGGQRSAAMASVLSQVGWRVWLLRGGYKTYRRGVMRSLYEPGATPTVVLLDGDTGTAKTDILHRLTALGVQTLDLEGLAGHRGSLFGGLPGRAQPSQRLFESLLAAAMERLEPQRPVVIEAESSKIGEVMIPPRLWKAMSAAPAIVLNAPIQARARYLTETYGEALDNLEALEAAIDKMPRHLGREHREAWKAMARARQFESLARELMAGHYDPAYARSSLRSGRARVAEIALPDLGEHSRRRAAEEIAALLQDSPWTP